MLQLGAHRALLTRSALQFDFLRGTLPVGATLTRADASTCATYVNSAKQITTAAANVARFTCDPITGLMQGLLVEAATQNQVAISQDLSGAGWAASQTSIMAAAATSPDGTANAGRVVINSTTSSHHAQYGTVSLISGQSYAMSAFIKSSSGTLFYELNAGGGNGGNFRPSDGTLGVATGSGLTSGLTLTPFANGWYRFSQTFACNLTTTYSIRNYFSNGGSTNAQSISGDGTSGWYLWGLMVQDAGSALSSYIPTTGSALARAADVLKLAVPNGRYAAKIRRLSGLSTLAPQTVSAGSLTVPTDPSPVQQIVLQRVG